MAVRLNVMILSPGGGSHFQAQCDDCIGQLLGRPGLDVTFLERLPTAGDATTEALALESIGGHIACLAWQDADTVLAGLAMAGKPMARRSHTHDPSPPATESDVATSDMTLSTPGPTGPGSTGRMFFFDMRSPELSQTILPALQSLLKTLQVPLFQIAASSKPPPLAPTATPPLVASKTQKPAAVESVRPDSPDAAAANASPSRNGTPANNPPGPASGESLANGRAAADSGSLDRLI